MNMKENLRYALVSAMRGDAAPMVELGRLLPPAQTQAEMGRRVTPPQSWSVPRFDLGATAPTIRRGALPDWVTRSELDAALGDLRAMVASSTADVRDAVRDLSAEMRAMLDSRGAQVYGAERELGISAAYGRSGDEAKGGINTSDLVTIDPADPQGTAYDAVWTGDDLARLRDTTGCRIWVSVGGAGPLWETASGYRCELRRNGVASGGVVNQPLSVLLPNLDNEVQAIRIDQRFSGSDNIVFRIVRETLIPASNNNANTVLVSIDSGRSCAI